MCNRIIIALEKCQFSSTVFSTAYLKNYPLFWAAVRKRYPPAILSSVYGEVDAYHRGLTATVNSGSAIECDRFVRRFSDRARMDGASDKPKPKHVKGYDRMHDYGKMSIRRGLLIVKCSINLGSHGIFYILEFTNITISAWSTSPPNPGFQQTSLVDVVSNRQRGRLSCANIASRSAFVWNWMLLHNKHPY